MSTAVEIFLRKQEADVRMHSFVQRFQKIMQKQVDGYYRAAVRMFRVEYATYTDDMRQMLEDIDRAKENYRLLH